MMQHSTNYPVIDKEHIPGLHFPKGEVLENKTQIENRTKTLEEACRLGNEFKGKVRIVFMSDQGIKEVHTTIWNVGDNVISLKAGVFIPIHSIFSIEAV